MNTLPFCPNCRFPLLERSPDEPDPEIFTVVPRQWECLQPKPRLQETERATAEDVAARRAKLAGRLGGTGQNAARLSYTQKESEPCLGRNEAGTDACQTCSRERTERYSRDVCPNPECGEDLPQLPKLTHLRPGTITVAGVRGAGKTHFIVALEDWWDKHLNELGWTNLPAMGSKAQALFDQFKTDLLDRDQALSATEQGTMQAFSWLLMPEFSSSAEPFLVTLPDVSGERLLKLEYLLHNRHYDNVDGIIMLLDGERIALAQGLVDDAAASGTGVSRRPGDHQRVLTTMIQYLLQTMTARDLAKKHIAVCVNKIDYLKKLDERWAYLTSNWKPEHNGRFDFFNCNERSKAIKGILMSDENTKTICRKLESSFGENVMYFAIATLGSDPAASDGEIHWNPQGVGDPFIWLLYQLYAIDDNQDGGAHYDD